MKGVHEMKKKWKDNLLPIVLTVIMVFMLVVGCGIDAVSGSSLPQTEMVTTATVEVMTSYLTADVSSLNQ